MALDYDNSAFYYFAIFALLVYIVPSTWYIIKSVRKYQREVAQKGRTEEESQALEERLKRRVLLTRGYTINLIATAVCILLFVLLCFLVSGDSEIARYDPFEILGVSSGATDQEIKKAYRHLAREKHPDKNPDNPNAEEEFQVIAKAYEALTDPIAKENFEKYGNPDGKQTMELSIGLPAFLTDGRNQAVFVALYIIGLVIIIPYVVFRRNKKNRKYGAKGNRHPLNSQLMGFTWRLWGFHLRTYKPLDTLAALYASAEEFRDMDPPDDRMNACIELWDKNMANVNAPFAKESKRVKKLQKRQKGEVSAEQEDPWRIFPGQYHTMLLYFHLTRNTHLLTEDMKSDLVFMLSKLELFNQAMTDVAAGVPNNALGSIELSQRITQAVWLDKDASALIPKLPELIEANKSKKAKNLQVPSLWQLIDRHQKNMKLIPGVDLKGEDEEHVLKYLNILPFPTLRAKVYVAEGEEGVIRPGDILTIEATLQYEQYVKKSEEEESEGEEKKEEDKEIEEDSLDAQLVNPDEDDADKPEFVDATSHNLRVYAPHFPHDRNDQWWIVVIERQGATPATKVAKKGAVNRKKMKGVDKRAKKIEKMERTERVVICERFDLKEPYVRKVMQIRPSTLIAGERVFEVHVRSAAYFGLDPPPVLASLTVDRSALPEDEEDDSGKKGENAGEEDSYDEGEEGEEQGERDYEYDSDEDFNPDEE